MPFIKSNNTDHAASEWHFGVSDRLGREIGSVITTFRVERTELTQDEIDAKKAVSKYWTPIEGTPGTKFAFRIQATRNGNHHQAGHTSRYFDTVEERDAALVKALADSRKRALSPAARLRA